MKRLMSTALVGCTMALFTSLAPAAEGAASGAGTGTTSADTHTSAKAGAMVRSDRNFMEQAAQNSFAEIEGSKLAQSKSGNEKVKAFAQQMVDDHTKTNEELSALASKKNVKLPTEPSTVQKSKAKAMSALEGARFDRQYAETIGVKAHEDTLKMFQKAASGAKDPDVKAFAAKTVPALEQHLKMARDLRASLGK